MAHYYSSKLKQVAGSRKVWATTICIVVSMLLFSAGEIGGEQFASAMVTSTGIFVGAVALEDGLSTVIRTWLDDVNQLPTGPEEK